MSIYHVVAQLSLTYKNLHCTSDQKPISVISISKARNSAKNL